MKKLFKILFVFLILLSSSRVFAVNLSIDTDNKKVKSGDMFTTTINLDTDGDSINTVEGDLVYDKNFLNIEKINIGNSFINFWVEKPDIKNPGNVHFAGITPGGVVLDKGEVFSIVFRARKEGSLDLSLRNINLYLNDGSGTKINAKVSNSSVVVSKNINGVETPLSLKDSIVPDKFNIIRTKDSVIFENKYFIIFNSSDKETGIDHYQVCEYWSCVDAESPYLLKYQNNFYHIVVRAYDGNGNVRISKMTSPYLFLLALVLFLVFLFFLRRYLNFNRV